MEDQAVATEQPDDAEPSNLDVWVGLRMSEDLRDRALKIADRETRSLSSVLRQALTLFVEIKEKRG